VRAHGRFGCLRVALRDRFGNQTMLAVVLGDPLGAGGRGSTCDLHPYIDPDLAQHLVEFCGKMVAGGSDDGEMKSEIDLARRGILRRGCRINDPGRLE
jgi:hypothetical protein